MEEVLHHLIQVSGLGYPSYPRITEFVRGSRVVQDFLKPTIVSRSWAFRCALSQTYWWLVGGKEI